MWTEQAGYALDLSIGQNGDAWKIDPSDSFPYKFESSSWVNKGSIKSSKIEVGPTDVWIVDSENKVYRYSDSTWVEVPDELATDIAMCPDGSGYLISTDKTISYT